MMPTHDPLSQTLSALADPTPRAQTLTLTEKNMTESFNATFGDDPRVYYASYAGRSNRDGGSEACAGAVYLNDPRVVDGLQVPFMPTGRFFFRTLLPVAW